MKLSINLQSFVHIFQELLPSVFGSSKIVAYAHIKLLQLFALLPEVSRIHPPQSLNRLI